MTTVPSAEADSDRQRGSSPRESGRSTRFRTSCKMHACPWPPSIPTRCWMPEESVAAGAEDQLAVGRDRVGIDLVSRIGRGKTSEVHHAAGLGPVVGVLAPGAGRHRAVGAEREHLAGAVIGKDAAGRNHEAAAVGVPDRRGTIDSQRAVAGRAADGAAVIGDRRSPDWKAESGVAREERAKRVQCGPDRSAARGAPDPGGDLAAPFQSMPTTARSRRR